MFWRPEMDPMVGALWFQVAACISETIIAGQLFHRFAVQLLWAQVLASPQLGATFTAMSSPWLSLCTSRHLAIGARPADWRIEKLSTQTSASATPATAMYLDMDTEPKAEQKETQALIIGGQGVKIGGPTPI